MPKILVVYGTTDGHTAKISAVMAETLRALGMTVDVHDASQADCGAGPYDGVIVAAPVRGGRYKAAVVRWVRANLGASSTKPSAFVSVCLGVLQHDAAVDRELKAIVDRFLSATGWQPAATKIVAGALLYTTYNWLVRFFMRRIAAKAGGDTDTTRDYEYTDWNDVRAFATQFGQMVQARPVPIAEAVAAAEAR